MGRESASDEGHADLLNAIEGAARETRAQAAAMGELSAKLSESVDALAAELRALAERLRAEASEARSEARRETPARSDDVDGARLVALNMALNGDSREETERYLAENFDVPDRDRLLDEVYAAIEG